MSAVEKFPSNSADRKVEEITEPRRPRVRQIAKGQRRQRSRLRQELVTEDVRTVGSDVMSDVILPAIKDLVFDIVSESFSRVLFGRSRTPSRSRSSGYTSYQQSYPGSTPYSSARQPATVRAYRPAWEPVVVATRQEASLVLQSMAEIRDEYGSVSVADLYGLIGITPEYTDENRGWTNPGVFEGVHIRRTSGGYLLNLPEPVSITDRI